MGVILPASSEGGSGEILSRDTQRFGIKNFQEWMRGVKKSRGNDLKFSAYLQELE